MMNPSCATSSKSPDKNFIIIVFSIAVILLGSIPVIFSCTPLPTSDLFRAHSGLANAGRLTLAAVVAGSILLISRLDSDQGIGKYQRYVGFILVAGLLTELHYFIVDRFHMDWQWEQFSGILHHKYEPPHQYRFLPQGMLWWMTLCNGDFVFSYVAYRFLFTFLVCVSIYKFARLYLASRDAIIVVLVYSAFYPLSTRYYYGNLLDPMSHTVMLAALLCCGYKEFWCFFWLFVLGVFIKETMLVLAPCFWLMNLNTFSLGDRRQWWRAALLVFSGVAAFVFCRLPFHFRPSFQSLNGAGLMIWANLGLPGAHAWSTVPVSLRYIHPLLFIFMWLPLILWRRRWLSTSLFWTTIYLAATMYLSNLCFGWNYESRNFIPPLVVLVVCTVMITNSLATEQCPTSLVKKVKFNPQARELKSK